MLKLLTNAATGAQWPLKCQSNLPRIPILTEFRLHVRTKFLHRFYNCLPASPFSIVI